MARKSNGTQKTQVTRKAFGYTNQQGTAVSQPATVTTVNKKVGVTQKSSRGTKTGVGALADKSPVSTNKPVSSDPKRNTMDDENYVTKSPNRTAKQQREAAKSKRSKPVDRPSSVTTRVNIPHFDLLAKPEQQLVVQTSNDALRELSEDELLDLLTKVRRQRDKYSKLHRRQGADEVEDAGGRGLAARNNQRTLTKAEVFEDALARVTRRSSIVARQHAAELKKQRLAAARAVKEGQSPRGARTAGSGKVGDVQHKGRVKRITPQQIKMGAAARSTQRRNQAGKDARN